MPPPVNTHLYEIAAEKFRSGEWSVDVVAGKVWSHRYGRHIGAVHPSIGYIQLTIVVLPFGTPNRTRTVVAHRVIWEALNGPIPEGLEINHKNLDKTDNRPSNLELVTRGENVRHFYATKKAA